VRRLVAEVIAELALITSCSACWRIPRIELVLGVSLQQARQALESLDQEALGARGMGFGTDAPPLPMRAVPKKPTIRGVMKKDRFRMTPAAKKVLEAAVKPNRRKTQVTAQQLLARSSLSNREIPPRCCWVLST
jgi:hypothetical protein